MLSFLDSFCIFLLNLPIGRRLKLNGTTFSCKYWNTINKEGTINSNASVPITIPPTVPVPSELLPLAPTPLATINGNKPKIMDQRRHQDRTQTSLAAERAAEVRLIPALRRSVAYSVSKIAVLASRPININQSGLQIKYYFPVPSSWQTRNCPSNRMVQITTLQME